jgi:hypothetical protein
MSVKFDNLVNETTYYMWIKSKNKIGKSDFSSQKTGTPMPIPSPAHLSLKSGNGQLSISWEEVPNTTGYEVFYDTKNIQPENSSITTSGTGTIIKGLTNYTTYYIWVRAKNIAGVSVSSSVNGNPIGAPSMPEGLTYSRSFTASFIIHLKCSPVQWATKYRWELRRRDSSDFREKYSTTNTVSYDSTNDKISYNADYLFRVRAENDAGVSEWSQLVLIPGWY